MTHDMMHGLSDLAMWLFITVVTVLGMLLPFLRRLMRQREIQLTIRTLAQSGQTIDPAMIERLVNGSGGGDNPARVSTPNSYGRRLALPALILVAVGIGLALLGYFIGFENGGHPVYPLYGVGALVSLIGVAMGGYAIWLMNAFPPEGPGAGR